MPRVRVTYSGTIGGYPIRAFYASAEDALAQIALDQENGRLGPGTGLDEVLAIETADEPGPVIGRATVAELVASYQAGLDQAETLREQALEQAAADLAADTAAAAPPFVVADPAPAEEPAP